MAGTESGPEVDLFGEAPAPYRDPRGRRKLRFDAETYEKVEELAALGMSKEAIASHINVSVPTLRKYFFPELDKADARTRGRVLKALMDKVDAGSVPAIRLALQLLDQGKAVAADEAVERRGRGEAKPPKLGKKEEQHLAATRIGGRLSVPEAPRLVVSNRA